MADCARGAGLGQVRRYRRRIAGTAYVRAWVERGTFPPLATRTPLRRYTYSGGKSRLPDYTLVVKDDRPERSAVRVSVRTCVPFSGERSESSSTFSRS